MPFKAHSTLFYGVFVNSLSLCFAADAHEATKEMQSAIDMIKARKRRGQIHLTTPYKALARIPEEVWQLLRDHVIDQAVVEAEQEALRVFCSSTGLDLRSGLPKNWEEEELSKVAGFWDAFRESEGVERLLEKRVDVNYSKLSTKVYHLFDTDAPLTVTKEIENLLQSFGLAFPLNRVFRDLDFKKYDYYGGSAIALSMRETPSASYTLSHPSFPPSPSFPRSTALAVDSHPSWRRFADEQVHFSHSTFSLPPNVDTRFKLFCSRFNLQAMNPAGPTWHPPLTTSQSSDDESEDSHEKDEVAHFEREHGRVCCLYPIDPHWQMVTTADAVFD